MEIISLDETLQWMAAAGLADTKGKLLLSEYKAVVSSVITHDSGRKTALAAAIGGLFEKDSGALLWINEFGIWPSCEDRNLFKAFRASLGEREELYRKPGHLFSDADLPNISSLVGMALYFCWGAVLFSKNKKIIVVISHDEIIEIYIKTEPVNEEIKQKLDLISDIAKVECASLDKQA